jgi:uncharacterized membrane protein required for colicin V production
MEEILNAPYFSALIDILALSIIVIFTIIGFVKGFAKTFVKIFGTILSLLFAVLLCTAFANFLENTFGLVTGISNGIMGLVSRIFGDKIANTTLEQAVLSDLNEAGLPEWIISVIMGLKENIDIPTNVTLNQIISPTLGYYVACGIALIILYILFKVAFFLLGEVISKLHSIILVGAIDRVLGLAIGLIRGVVILQIASIVINIIPIEFTQQLSMALGNSKIYGFIMNVNIFDIIIKALSIINIKDRIAEFVGKIA